MILLTGTSTSVVPFEVHVLPPKVFSDRKEVSEYVDEQFTQVLKEKEACTDGCLPPGWETGTTLTSKESAGGITYHVYVEKEQGVVTYHLKSDTIHVVYRLDHISVSENKVTMDALKTVPRVSGPDTLYWNITPHPAVRIALMMSLISGYAASKVDAGAELPKTYEEVANVVPEDDPVTTMLIVYAMLRANDKYALFHVQDGSLFLYSDQGFIGVDEVVQGLEDGQLCDPDKLYAFSSMYKDIPSTVDGAIEMFSDKLKVETQFRSLMAEAFSPGVAWKNKVDEMMNLIDTSNDRDTISYTLMRIVAKHKLLKGASMIFSQLPCSIPNEQSP